tara:strand:+ start:15 stop:209 length:195 start_codon:yes stop_codon:yes gene_type:complete
MGEKKLLRRKQINRTERWYGSEKIKKNCLSCRKTFLADTKHIFVCNQCKNSRRGNIATIYEEAY